MSPATLEGPTAAQKYEPYSGRWSRAVAKEFLEWLEPAPQSRWLDVGCGTGALTEAILARAEPRAVRGIDASEGFLAHARGRIGDARASFALGDAQSLAAEAGGFDYSVSGLVLNFLRSPSRGAGQMKRAARAGGTVAAYVWDYAGRMDLVRRFWDAAVELDAGAAPLDEAMRFPLCRPNSLAALFTNAGLADVAVREIDVRAVFRSFDDYWMPFLGGQGPAPTYALSLPEDRRAALRERLRTMLPIFADGSIPLTARAWAVRGRA